MTRKVATFLVVLLAPLVCAFAAAANDALWFSDSGGEKKVVLYFFFSNDCPHCAAAKPVIRRLARERPWLDLQEREVGDEANERLFFMLAREFGREPEAVPTFFICDEMIVGFDAATGGEAEIAALAETCHGRIGGATTEAPAPSSAEPASGTVAIPFFGAVDVNQLSLPVLTVVLGGLDAFNPCAFFVLLFLLSIMVHARSRRRMALVGGLFVTISGVMYFLFMAAWLNLFLVLHNVVWITAAAGLIAIVIGLLAIKDYFFFRRGVSLSIPEGAKPGLFRRMGALVGETSLPMLLVGTALLAIMANMYELLCTSGFPMVYTKILTENALSSSTRYLYLAAYNVIYVIPLLVIVGVFVATLGGRKLSEGEGRVLKLLSGLMMTGLGLVLVVAPELLSNVLVAVGLLAGAVALTFIVSRFRPAEPSAR